MASCEMCGFNGELKRAVVEGSLLMLCDKCIKFGEAVELKKGPSDFVVSERIKKMSTSRFSSMKSSGVYSESEEELVVKNYSELVKKARERMSKTQEEVAKDLAEKVSIVQGVENGRLEPSLKLAKKLEQYFKIELIRKLSTNSGSEEMEDDLGLKPGSMTIGDLIKIKK